MIQSKVGHTNQFPLENIFIVEYVTFIKKKKLSIIFYLNNPLVSAISVGFMFSFFNIYSSSISTLFYYTTFIFFLLTTL